MSQSTRVNNSRASYPSFCLLCPQKKLVLESIASLRPCEEAFVLKVVKMSKRDCCEATWATLCCGHTGFLGETLCLTSISWLRWLASAVSHRVTPLSPCPFWHCFHTCIQFQILQFTHTHARTRLSGGKTVCKWNSHYCRSLNSFPKWQLV